MFSEDVFKKSWLRPIYSSWSYVFKTSSRRFPNIFKTSRKNVFKTPCKTRLQDIFKTSSSRFQDVFKTSLRHLQDFLLRLPQEVFKSKTSLRHLQNVLKTFWRRLQDLSRTSSTRLAKMSSRRFEDVLWG